MKRTSQTGAPTGGTVAGRSSRAPAAATIIGVLCATLLACSMWMTALNGGATDGIGELLTLTFALYAYLVVGLVIFAKTPRNPLGWAMIGVGVLTSVGVLAGEVAEYAFTVPGRSVPGATFAAWINSWWWFPAITLVFLFVPLLFPNGQPLSPRWRWLTRLSVGLFVLLLLVAPLNPVLEDDSYEIRNPIGVAAVGDIENSPVGSVILFALLAFTLLALISLIVRFRRSRGVERQQMKWFVFGAVLIVLLLVVEEGLSVLKLDHLLPDSNVVFGLAVAVLPVSIGIAVLKYRLYDIDRIISRTLSYAVLTALLLGLYLGAVATITTVTAPAAGDSPLAVAAATLLAAAAFRPAQRRIQATVDRRFNRARYDAARTVDEFRTRLRDELDLTAITADVESAVNRTVAPSQVAVWLRTEGSR